jgi:hypothetical protein
MQAETKKYYVYTLTYSDEKVFYVGKGVGQRIVAHEREAKTGCACDKCKAIREA